MTYCAPCDAVHPNVMNPCDMTRLLRSKDAELRNLESIVAEKELLIDGWRMSDTAILIQERDEARAALALAHQELGMRRHPSGGFVDGEKADALEAAAKARATLAYGATW